MNDGPLDATRVERDTLLDEVVKPSSDETETVVDQNLGSVSHKSLGNLKLSSTFGPSIFSEVSTLLSTDAVSSSDHTGNYIDADLTYDVTKGPYTGTDHLAQDSGARPQSNELSRFAISARLRVLELRGAPQGYLGSLHRFDHHSHHRDR